MKKHIVTEWSEFSPPAYVSNGFIGFRFPKNPFKETVGLLSGFYGVKEGPDVEAFSIIPTPNITFYCMNKPVEPQIISQSYDFSTGELETSAILNCADTVTNVTYTVFCSRTSPTLLVSSMKFKSDKSCRINVNVAYQIQDKYASTVSEIEGYPYYKGDHDGKFKLYSSDRATTAGVAFRLFGSFVSVEHISPLNVSAEVESTEDGNEIQLITSYVPGIMHREPHNQAHRLIKLAAWNGFERIRDKNRAAWDKLWESRIVIDGAQEEWQNVIDASYFYLMSSMSAFAPISVPPYGLSHATAYEGHCFWDTESFMFMTPLFCEPDIAYSMLDYRFSRLESAKNNARLNGYRGVQFPWQSGTDGCEVTVPFAGQAGGAGEQHVNLDVALAFDAYAKVSGDERFIGEMAWPVLQGVADWIVSRAEKTPRGYEILHVTGIDEENILLTLHARQHSNAKVITKINRITFRDAISSLDLGSVIYPRYITSEAIVAYVRAKKNSMNSNVETLNHLCNSRVEAIEFRVNEPSAATGKTLRELKPKMKKDILIAFINRNGKILIPSGNDTIEAGDTVMLVTTHTGLDDIRDILA